MENKQIVKNFYELVVSKNSLQELYQYISKDCLLNIGNEKIPFGLEGMREHLVAIKKTYPDYTIKILRQFSDGDI